MICAAILLFVPCQSSPIISDQGRQELGYFAHALSRFSFARGLKASASFVLLGVVFSPAYISLGLDSYIFLPWDRGGSHVYQGICKGCLVLLRL